jgi:hypothetical protein
MLDQKCCTNPTDPEMRQLLQQPSSKPKRQTQTISLSELLISSVFLYVSSGVFCVK